MFSRRVLKKSRIKQSIFVRINEGGYFQPYSSHVNSSKKGIDYSSPFPEIYKPGDVESQWYDWWERKGFFKLEDDKNKRVFSMVLPPPNVTGTLHIGHALVVTIQDVLARWHRMKGDSVEWIPGTDHAGIATQVVVEKYLKKELNLSKFDVGREKFVDYVWKWKETKGDIILKQLRMMGASVDWDKYLFTMDSVQNEAVNKAFIDLYKKKLIYRANSLINWSCGLQSSISDIEVEKLDLEKATKLSIPGYDKPVVFGTITDFAYKVCDEGEEELVVSTTRPETMLADVAIAVHSNDKRYSKYRNKHVWHPFRKCKLPIILDEGDFVNPEFGTGAVKITPGHDHNDFQFGLKHNLPVVECIDERGVMYNSSEFDGMKRFDARTSVCDKLQTLGLFRGTRDHQMSIPVCSRNGDVIEYLLKPQWFVNCKEMARRALEAVDDKQLMFLPERFTRVWKNWLVDSRDWNVSRQLWWGHPIPMYRVKYKSGRERWTAALNKRQAVSECNSEDGDVIASVEQDEDVLDTWFSSSLYPLSTHGWPRQDLSHVSTYPLSLMVTGHDIIFFWVARMVMMGLELTGKLPFEKVLFHGVVCDSKGKKMSKSAGNVLNPEDIVRGVDLDQLHSQTDQAYNMGLLNKLQLNQAKKEQTKLFPNGIPECGSDSLRLSLCSVNVQSDYINFDINHNVSNLHFCNKIWQSVRYFRSCLSSHDPSTLTCRLDDINMGMFDKWVVSRMAVMLRDVDSCFDEYKFHGAVNRFREFYYGDFCNVYLETTKPVIRHGTPESQSAVLTCLFNCVEVSLRVLAPIMPYLSEELYQRLPKFRHWTPAESVTVADYPDWSTWSTWHDPHLERNVEQVLHMLSSVRSLRRFYDVPKDRTRVNIQTNSTVFEECQQYLPHLSHIKHFTVNKVAECTLPSTSLTLEDLGTVSLYFDISQEEFIDKSKSILLKEVKLQDKYERLKKIFSTDDYFSNNSEETQKKDKITLQNLEAELNRIQNIKQNFNLEQ